MTCAQKKRLRCDEVDSDMEWALCSKQLKVVNNDLELEKSPMELSIDDENIEQQHLEAPEVQLPLLPHKLRARRRIDNAIDEVIRKYRRQYEEESSFETMQVAEVGPDPRVDLRLKVCRPVESLAIIPVMPVNGIKEPQAETEGSVNRRRNFQPLQSINNEYLTGYTHIIN